MGLPHVTLLWDIDNSMGYQANLTEYRNIYIHADKFARLSDCRLYKPSPYSRTNMPAIPIPVPMHMLTTPTSWPARSISGNRVASCLAPVAPNG